MYFIVYKTTHLPTGKFYIGRHVAKTEVDSYFGSGTLISRMLKKHPKEEFIRQNIKICSTFEEMLQLESDLIDEVLNSDGCLNLIVGDPKNGGLVRVSEATRANMSKSRTGTKASEESKRKMSESKKKTHNTPEVKAKLSHNAKNRSEETRYKLGGANRGKKISQDIRDKLSATISGAGNPRAKEWEILFEDGRKSIKVKGLKEWCRDQGVKYISLYVKAKRGDVSFLNGIRVVEC